VGPYIKPDIRKGGPDVLINSMGSTAGTEAFRAVAGAGVNTRDNPPSVESFMPVTEHAGGFFDNKERAKARVAKVQAGRQ
jgi:hypothetical protein